MSGETQPNTVDWLSASELTMLFGRDFAQKSMFDNVQLLGSDEKVSAPQLGQAILTNALLACHEQGVVRFSVQEQKALLGLRKNKILMVTPAEQEVSWPAYSWEASISAYVQRLPASQGIRIYQCIYDLLEVDTSNPWQDVIKRVQKGMAERQLLHGVEETKMKIFTSTRYVLIEGTAEKLAHLSAEPVIRMQKDFDEEHGEQVNLLAKEIGAAIKARTVQDSPEIDF